MCEFGRHITARELRSEVALRYLFNFSKVRFAEAVDRGVEAARAWCDTNAFSCSLFDWRELDLLRRPETAAFCLASAALMRILP